MGRFQAHKAGVANIATNVAVKVKQITAKHFLLVVKVSEIFSNTVKKIVLHIFGKLSVPRNCILSTSSHFPRPSTTCPKPVWRGYINKFQENTESFYDF